MKRRAVPIVSASLAALMVSGMWFSSAGGAPVGTVSEFSAGITTGAHPDGIAAGPDGNLWFTEYSADRIGRITPGGTVTEFSTGISAGSNPDGIAAGSDGNLWFTEYSADRIGRITTGGTVTEFAGGISAGSFPEGIAAGPDGNVWFTEFGGSRIGRITPGGTVTEFAGINAGSFPRGITAGPDGNLWFAETQNRIGRITPTGTITEFPVSPISYPRGIAAGPDGNLWFTEFFSNQVGRITPSGVVTEFSAGISANSGPDAIAAGPDGNLWFTENGGDRIGRITPTGAVTEFSAGISASGGPDGITAGPDGNVWFTEYDGGRIGRITPTATTPGGPCVAGPQSPPPTGSITRLAGLDRDATSVAVSQAGFPTAGSAAAIVLATDSAYPDALAGTPFAAAKHAPLLLTGPSSLAAPVVAEISRAAPKGSTVYLLGGTAALGSSIDGQVQALGDTPQRLAGPNRFATAVAIAGALGDPPSILEATGLGFPDALSAGAAAVASKAAVLLTNGSSQAPETAAYVNAHNGDTRTAVGGPAAAADPSAAPVVGADRYATSVLVARQFFAAPTTLGFASGSAFPDALSGGANIGGVGGPLLLVPSCGSLPSSLSGYLTTVSAGVTGGFLYGGSLAVGDDVLGQLDQSA